MYHSYYDEGYKAAFDGLDSEVNPYRKGSRNHDYWREGWEDCVAEDQFNGDN